MVELLHQQHQPAPARRHPNLILHCGAHHTERRVVERIPTPAPTETWTPIPHAHLIEQVEKTLAASQLTVGTFAHSLSHGGARYFGLMEVQNGENSDDYCWVLGLRN